MRSKSMNDQPLGYRVNIFLARLCFRGIYFPMMGKMAWVKVIAQNRRTIFKLVREGFKAWCLARRAGADFRHAGAADRGRRSDIASGG